MKIIKRINFLTLIIFLTCFSACKNEIIEEGYYYIEKANIDGMKIFLKGNGYGVYGQMLEKYKNGSIRSLMKGKAMKIKGSSFDDNNSNYNEIFLTFEKESFLETFETDVSVKKEEGLVSFRISCVDAAGNEQTLSTQYPPAGKITVEKDIKSITLYIKGYKYYPSSYGSLSYKGQITAEKFEDMKGKQVDNEFTINSVKLGFKP